LEVLFSFAVPSTALLFFLRARAVFGCNPFAVAVFAVLWLAVLAGSLTTIPGLAGINIGPTPDCITGGIKSYGAAGAITPLINDGIVFFAISLPLWRNSWASRTIKNGVRVMVFGDYLPVFSKSMLQEGQIYFLSVFSYRILTATPANNELFIFDRTSVIANFLTGAMLYASSLPAPRTMFTIPNAALMNIMACRVYREMMLLGGSRENQSSSHNSNPNPPTHISLSLMGHSESGDGTKQGVNPTTKNLVVSFSKTVESSSSPSEAGKEGMEIISEMV
jgi:hypothetical protein